MIVRDYHGDFSSAHDQFPIIRQRFGDVGAARIARFEQRKKRRAFWAAVAISLVALGAVALITVSLIAMGVHP